MIRVYVAGPMFSSGRLTHNVSEGLRMYHDLIDLDYFPYLPHFGVHADIYRPRPESEWLALDKAYLSVCDALIRLPGFSRGADLEEQWCKEFGIPVFHSLEALEQWRNER